MKANVNESPPLDNALLDRSIRRAVEAAYKDLSRQVGDVRSRLDMYARSDRPDIVVADNLSRLPAPRRGALALTVESRVLYGADGEEWFMVGGGGTGGGSLEPHGLGDTDIHTGTLLKSQAPWALDGELLAGAGLALVDNTLNVGAGDGIIVGVNSISLDPTVAGAGLTFLSGVVSVGAGNMMSVSANSVAVKQGDVGQFIGTSEDGTPIYRDLSSLAGAGLWSSGGALAVGAENTGAVGLTIEADAIRLTSSSAPSNNARVLATNADGGINLDDNLLNVDGANGRVGIGREPAGAALDVMAFNDSDHTQRLKQKVGQTGSLWRVEDAAGNGLIVLTSAGDLQSGKPSFVSGVTGWRMTADGVLEAAHAWIRGELHASIFVMDEFHSSGGTLFVAPAGKLENDAALSTSSDPDLVSVRTTSADGSGTVIDIRTESVSGSGAQITARMVENYLDITDPPSGHAMVFSVGDRLRCKTMALGVGLDVYDVWMQVTHVEDMTDYYRYRVTLIRGVFGELFGYPTLPAGAAVINYRKKGDGLIMLTSDQQDAPYIQVIISGDEPWNGDFQAPLRMGLLNGVGLPGIKANADDKDYGIVLGQNLADANSPYFLASDKRLKSFRIDSTWNNGDNDTVGISADGRVRMGPNIGQAATTGFDFDPATGQVTIGGPTYPYDVLIYGRLVLPDGTEASSMRWRGTWGSGLEYAKQDAVNYGGSSWIADEAHTSSPSNSPGTGAMWAVLALQGTDGADGADGQSIVVQYSVTGNTGTWHSTFGTGDIFMRQSVDGGSTWGLAIRIVGESGTPGVDGNITQYVFKRAAAQPSAPFGNGVPTAQGWLDSPPTTGTDPIWMSRAIQTQAGVTIGSWSTPVRITGDQGLQGPAGTNGIPGTNGTDGLTSYFHVAYATSITGENFSQVSGPYIGTYVDFSPLDSSNPADYAWRKFEGTDGIPGTNGANGQTSYLHIKYSNDGGTTFTANSGETPGSWIGTYVDFAQADSTSVSSYTWAKIEGPAGANAKLVKLVASTQVFGVDAIGTATPSSVTFTAIGQNASGSPTFEVTAGTATLGGSGTTRTLSYNNLGSDSATIRVTWDGVTDEVTVVKVYAGQDGSDGLSGLTVILTNEAHLLPASSAGAIGSYMGSGTQIQAWEGTTALPAGGSSGARFSVTLISELITNVRATAFSDQNFLDIRTTSAIGSGTQITARSLPVTPGAITYAGTVATVADHSAMSSALDALALTYQVTVVRANGESVTIPREQRLGKSRQGADGPTGPPGADNQDFPFLADDRAALRAANGGAGALAGMYMVSDYVGHFTGGTLGDFDMYMGVDAEGDAEFKFGGTGNAVLGYAGGKLRGVNGAGAEQWYASALDGKLYWGGGNGIQDALGIALKTTTGLTDIPGSILAWYTTPATRTDLAGRIAAGSFDLVGQQSGMILEIAGEAASGTQPGLWFKDPFGVYRIYHAGNLTPSNYAALSGATFTGPVAAPAVASSAIRSDATITMTNVAGSAYQGLLTQFITSVSGNFYSDAAAFVFSNTAGNGYKDLVLRHMGLSGGNINSDNAIQLLNWAANSTQSLRTRSLLASSDYSHASRVPDTGIYSLGAVAIGTPGAIASGYMLDVNGAALIRTSATVQGNFAVSGYLGESWRPSTDTAVITWSSGNGAAVSGRAAFGIRKFGDMVFFKGSAGLGAISGRNKIATLASGYRPTNKVGWKTITGGVDVLLEVESDGSIYITNGSTWVSFDALQFSTT